MKAIVTALAAALLISGCTSASQSDSTNTSVSADDIDFHGPKRSQLSTGVRLGDQTSQYFHEAATSGTTVVVGGSDESANTSRPLLVVSDDKGESWERVELPNPESNQALPVPDLVDLAGSDHGFVAVGSDDGARTFLWTSPDGYDWQAVVPEDGLFGPRDSFTTLTYADGEFLLLGTHDVATNDAPWTPVLWASPDGEQWKRHDLDQAGISGYPGSFSPGDVTVHRGQVIVAGTIQDASQQDQPDRIAIWRGQRDISDFHRDDLPLDFAGTVRAYADDLVVDDGQLYLAASGDTGADSQTWDGVVMEQRGGSWIKHAALGGAAEELTGTLLSVGNRWILTASADDTDAVIAAGSSLDDLERLRHRSLSGNRDQGVTAATAVGSTAVLAGYSDASGVSSPKIWLVRGGKVQLAKLPAGVSQGRPSPWLADVVPRGRGAVVVGTVASSPVAWEEQGDEWIPSGMAGFNNETESISVSAVSRLRNGSLMAVGGVNRRNGNDVGAWVLPRESGTWRRVIELAFTKSDAKQYGSVWANDIAATSRAVVAVGDGVTNGNEEVYPIRATPEGISWEAARGFGRRARTEADRYHNTTPFVDFRAPTNGGIGMSTVSGVRATFVAGGHRSEAARGARPWIWRSVDAGRTWAKGRALPRPKGAYAAAVSDSLMKGDAVVLVGGYVTDAEDDTPGVISWTSDDGGRTWTIGNPVEGDVSFDSVVSTPDGYVALGSTDDGGDTTAAAWYSEDGLAWEAMDLDNARFEGPGSQNLAMGWVDGEVLRVIGFDVPPGGGGYYTTQIPLP